MQLRNGIVLNDRYRIIRNLGHGGFGALYLADDLNTGGICAVKENLDDSQEDVMGKFLREASMLYNLSHSNLPEVWDHFVIPGEGQYLVMEYVEGDSLSAILDRIGKPLPERKVITWISQVCDALTSMRSSSSRAGPR